MTETLLIGGIPVIGVLTGAVYLKLSRRDASIGRRLLSSAYGPVIALMYLAIFLLVPQDYRHRDEVGYFQWSLVVPLVLMACSVAFYPGTWKVHLLLPLNLIALVGLFVVGTVAIAGL